MKDYEFRFLTQKEQNELIKERGIYLAQRQWLGINYFLYELDISLYVEVSEYNLCRGFYSYYTDDVLSYLKDINITIPGVELM